MSNRGDEGFVLPYVLVVIAVLAIATTIAAERLQRSTNILSKMQDKNRIERLLATAEAEAVYALMTGITVEQGIDLNPNSPVETEFGIFDLEADSLSSAPKAKKEKRDLWSGQGGLRASTTQGQPVYIELQDVSGLVSLSSGGEGDIIRLLAYLGLTNNEARTLTAKLKDYSDADNSRQFKGAERADYRLVNKSPPTNSPLRNYDELTQVLEWREALEKIDFNMLKKLTSLQPVEKVKKQFASAELLSLLGLDKQERDSPISTDFDFADLEALNTTMSDMSRLTFWVKNQDGAYHKRVVEIRRGANNIEKPYRRFWVYETTVLQDDLKPDIESENEIKNVIHPASVRIP